MTDHINFFEQQVFLCFGSYVVYAICITNYLHCQAFQGSKKPDGKWNQETKHKTPAEE